MSRFYGYEDGEQLYHAAETLKYSKLLDHLLQDQLDTALSKWQATNSDEAEAREEAWRDWKAADRLKTAIENAVAESLIEHEH